MSVFIQKYRGIDILFNADNERFSYQFDSGSWKEKQSFSACKKSIDDFFKLNATFSPFLVRHIKSGKILEITGIRKDNRFVYDYKGGKEQISDYSEQDYIEYDESHDKEYADIAELELQITELHEKISFIRESITGKSLKDLKSKYVMPV